MSISWESIKKFEDIKLERGQNKAEGIITKTRGDCCYTQRLNMN